MKKEVKAITNIFSKTPAQLFTLGIQKVSFAVAKDFPFSIPPSIVLEPTNACNLQCISCRKKSNLPEKTGFLDIRSAKNLLKEIGGYLNSILFNGFGEPLLHPDFCVFLSMFHKELPRAKVRFFTNGLLLSDQIIKSIIINEVYEIIISLDSTTAENYRKIRGADFSVILQNIQKLNNIKKSFKKKFPLVKASFTIVEENQNELLSFFDLLRALDIEPGLVEVVNTKWGYSGKVPGLSYVKAAYKKCGALFPDIDLKSVFPLFNKYSQPICPLPFVPYVAWNGDLKACCYMPIASEYSLGNVFTSSFNKVWHNKKNRYLRTELLHNRLLPFCHDCTLNNNS